MSLNKILNRPMFRKEALKKGVLKPIRAQVGTMVGPPYTPPGVPAIRKPPTFMERMKVSTPVRLAKTLGKGILGIPQLGGYYAGDKVGQALGIESDLARMPFGLAGAYYATKAMPALAALPAATSAALIAGPAYLGIAGKMEYDRIQKMSPKERAAHYAKSQQFGMSYLDDDQFNDQFGNLKPKTKKEVKQRSSAAPKEGPGSGRFNFGQNKSKELKAEGDLLLQDNVTTSDDIANLDSVQENSINVDSSSIPPGEKGGPGFVKKDKDAEMPAAEKKNIKNINTVQGNNEISLGGPSDDVEFNKTIALAKKYQEEVFKGEGSQAGLVFLANLASGLLTGTTAKAGLGGAMEVFGQAIGPAVNNYATIKLKEGELRARNRESSLNAALDHMKFLNDAANTAAERPEIDQYGIIQVRGNDGRLRNYKGIMYKNGTIGMPAGLDASGVEQYVPVPQGSPVMGSDGKPVGQYENFLEQNNVDKRLFDIQDILGNRYNALSVTRDVLKTLNQMDASGEKVKAGAALSIDQFTRRLSGVAKEVLGFEVGSMSLDALEAKVAELQADEYAAIDRDPDLSEEGKKAAKENLSSKNLIKEARKRLDKRGMLSDLSREEQEKLAVQEVTLTYALANTFKDQDRLTQRDVNAAKEIVNIFSLGRSSKDVRASIEAIGRQLESDIRRQESLYTVAGGLENTLKDLRRLKNFEVFEGEGGVVSQLAEDLSIEEIENIIEGIN